MTLAYFPEILPDELLYSVLARYHRHAGAGGARGTVAALFGLTHAIAAHDMPGHLDALAGRTDPRRGLTADRLLEDPTLYPYYVAFQPEPIRRETKEALRGGAADVHTRLGVAAFRVRGAKALRFCAECFSQMLGRHGESYWRRSHQLPGTLVCPDHRRPLQESTVSLRAGGRHRFVAADARSCPPEAPALCTARGGRALDRLVEIARASAGLLRTRPDPRDQRELTRDYRERLALTGLMRSPKRVDHESLAALFRAHWGAALAELPGTVEGAPPGAWLAGIVRSHRKAFHPLHHVLLRGFLDALPDDARVSRSARAAAAFGPGPWPCRNRLADHFGEPVADAFAMTRNRESTIGTTSCRCGYVYWRSLSPDGRLGPPRYRCYGPLLKPALERLAVPGARLTAVARELRLDCKTVQREAASFGVETPWACRPSGKPREEAAPTAGRAGPARRGRRRRQPGPRLDWRSIDAEFVRSLRREAEAILAAEPPVRVTLAELERRMGRRDWLLKRRRKLPLSTAEVRTLAESFADFQKRRARAAARRLSRDCGAPAAWRVMRAAGLRGSGLPLAEAELERHLAERHAEALAAAKRPQVFGPRGKPSAALKMRASRSS